MDEVSERWLKISSRIELPIDKSLVLNNDYKIVIYGTIVKNEIGSEQDGTVKVVHKMKPTEIEFE